MDSAKRHYDTRVTGENLTSTHHDLNVLEFLSTESDVALAADPASEGPAGAAGSEENPIAAVLVFKDPIDWYRDAQLALDVVTSGETSIDISQAASCYFSA